MNFFTINESDIPILPTRRALMVIDLQKGLVDSDGVVPTSKPRKLIQNLEALVPAFRKTGTILWYVILFLQKCAMSY